MLNYVNDDFKLFKHYSNILNSTIFRNDGLVGVAKALELLFTGKIIDAKEAKEIGLVNQVVPADELKTATLEMARGIVKAPPISIRMIKKGVYQGIDADLDTQVLWEHLVFNMSRQTEDHLEGARSFMEKREPKFKGR